MLGWSHLGMLAAARWVLSQTKYRLINALAQHPDYQLLIVGEHPGVLGGSRGGGRHALKECIHVLVQLVNIVLSRALAVARRGWAWRGKVKLDWAKCSGEALWHPKPLPGCNLVSPPTHATRPVVVHFFEVLLTTAAGWVAPAYCLALPGHSMGGGTAALLTMMVREKVRQAFAVFASLHLQCAASFWATLVMLMSGSHIQVALKHQALVPPPRAFLSIQNPCPET